MPRSRLSQNFLYDPPTLRRIVETAGVGPEDTVVEIGPGTGALTALLASRAGKVVAVELDPALYGGLKDRLGHIENLELIKGDALRLDYGGLGPFKVVANIPYHITTPLIFRLLEFKDSLRSMTLTVQKEVAKRVAASPGGKDYGVLSITVQYFCEAAVAFLVPKELFRPVPKVDSACLHLEVRKRPLVEVADEEFFFGLVRAAFEQRRKTLHNSLGRIVEDVDTVLEAAGIKPSERPERLSIEDFALLAAAAFKMAKPASRRP